MSSLKQHFLAFTLIASTLAANHAEAAPNKVFCSMTLNSSNEIETFRKSLKNQGFDFVELVPDSKDPSWFKKSCESGLQCDVLLISGHFGGLFFGESSSSTIGIEEMEEASCRNTCPGILKNPKEVFLMGCNTLATQTKDHRTVSQYLNVLIDDGIPLDFAEQVVASRYSQQGFSLEKRFAAIFNNSQKLYGFSSTGPLGAAAAPRLRQYINQVGPYSRHLEQLTSAPNQILQAQFSGTNFRETIPTQALDKDSRNLFCALRSDDTNLQGQALQRIVNEKKSVAYFDSLASQITATPDAFEGLLDNQNKKTLLQTMQKISDNNLNLITIQHQVLQVSQALGLIDDATKASRVRALLTQAYSQELNFSKVSQICGIIKQEPELTTLPMQKLRELSKISPYFMLTLGCYAHLNSDAKGFLFEKVLRPLQPSERTLALQILRPHWSHEDLPWLESALQSADSGLRTRIYLSARTLLTPYREKILTNPGLAACLLKSENEGAQQLGTNWACLTENQPELTVDVCDHFARLNGDPENSDDMRWFCWSNAQERLLKNKAECYALSSVMGILGNQMKMIWNCSHR